MPPRVSLARYAAVVSPRVRAGSIISIGLPHPATLRPGKCDAM